MEIAAGEGGVEVVETRGLADVVVHAGFQAALAVALHGVCRHRDDADAGGGGIRADAAGGFVTVELGHLAIHEDDVVGSGFEGFEHFEAVGGDFDGVAEIA